MKYTRRMSKALAAFAIGAALATVTRGEDYEAREQRVKQAEEELSQIDNAPKPGDEVVALRDTRLKAGKEAVGTVRKGEKLIVEQVQGKWLWVTSGRTRGWIDSGSVLGAKLLDWYARLPDNTTVTASGRIRAKYDGVLFEVADAGSRLLHNSFGGGSVNGFPVPNCVYANAKNVGVMVAKANGRGRTLSLRFPGGKNIFPEMPALRSYGAVVQGDYIVISAATRQVFVNGQLRQAGRR